MVVTLSVVTLVSALALGYVYEWTKEPIAQARLATQLEAISEVLPGYDNNPVDEQFNTVAENGDTLVFYPAVSNSASVGTAVKVRSGKGYSGDIWLMVGLDTAGVVHNIVVLSHRETPGLGSKIESEGFIFQFLQKHVSSFQVKKDGGSVDAISGATISSRAYCDAVNRARDAFMQKKKNHDH